MPAMLDLSAQEQTHVRAALRFVRLRYGGWAPVSKMLRFNETTLSGMATGQRPPSVVLAFRIAKLVKVPVDDVFGGRFPPQGTCPHCGHRTEPSSLAAT